MWIASLAFMGTLQGCALRPKEPEFFQPTVPHQELPIEREHPFSVIGETEPLEQPLSIHQGPRQVWLLAPEDAVQISLANSPVLRELGGLVIRSPATARTIHGPALSEADPRFGVDAALSEFDALFSSSARFNNNDYVSNNRFLGGGTNLIKQDLNTFQQQLSKRTAYGTEFFFRHNTDYDANNAPGNLFRSVWNTNFEAEMRQPLLQGLGTDFNRIAGPGGTPGVYNGIMIARVNADTSVIDFEMGLRDLVNNVENAYWDLYYAYRDLDAKIAARDAALTTWRQIQALGELPAGVADKEAQAREQYFRFQEEVQNALTGRVFEGTRTFNGSSGGTLIGNPGIQVAERRLRLLMGVPINDGYMIRPAHDPVLAKVSFDWLEISAEAALRRPELRRQELVVKRRELELLASRNFLWPRLDAVGLYRWRGFGHDLLNPDRAGRERFDNAYMNLTSGDFQEWQLGMEFSMPLGQRQAHAAVHHAQLFLARERSVLQEQRRQVMHDLSNALADMQRAYEICQTAFNRRVAAQKQLAILREREALGNKIDLNTMLDAQNRAADADSRYFRAQVEYVLAIKNVHFEKGTLLDYNNVYLAERVP